MRTTITDISSYQAGLKLSDLTGIDAVIAKCTEGTYYADMYFETWRKEAPSANKFFIWYHYLTTEDASAQARHTAYYMSDSSLVGMLDVEPTIMPNGTHSNPTVTDIANYVIAADKLGLTVKLVYLPHWYWEQLGKPDLTPLVNMGLYLISSSYPGGYQYPGDNGNGWTSYGGMHPLIWQYTSSYPLGSQRLDMNAYIGTLDELKMILTLKTGKTMTAIPQAIRDKWPSIASEFVGDYNDSNAIIWADAAARYTAQQINNLAQQHDNLSATVAAHLDAVGNALNTITLQLNGIVAVIQGGSGTLSGAMSPEEVAKAVVKLIAKDLGV